MSPKALGWRVFDRIHFIDENNPKHHMIITREKRHGWDGVVCRLERFVAYYLSVRRTKSWPFDGVLHSRRFERVYYRLQRILLFGGRGLSFG